MKSFEERDMDALAARSDAAEEEMLMSLENTGEGLARELVAVWVAAVLGLVLMVDHLLEDALLKVEFGEDCEA